MSDDRMERGVARMKELFGEGGGVEPGTDDFMDIIIEHVFGEVWTRPGLELRERSMITCAALVALGKEQQLQAHLRGAIHVGMSKQAIEEMMIHLAHYAGWPAAVNGLRVARELFDELDM